ncbi:methyl-accepting chemotaxis protein [Vibrio coralliilyticus]|uniref:methyl-accepting chemotaxis protein n=1 Tax=Vibrio coralliilyticus TaxID=190893 RepID=UPI00240A1C6D|nr:methyl-accepting chemotaxis protein [Vibrio coralliilyticus]WFB51021.1 methyl-accepting chemotaxis protein [Vibrio coralliilyticus]
MNTLSGFKNRIITVVVVLLFSALSVATYLSYSQLSRAISGHIYQQSMLELELASNSIERWVHGVQRGIENSAPDFAIPHTDEQVALMVEQVTHSLQVSSLYVVFTDGRSFSEHGLQHDLSHVSTDWFAQARQTGRAFMRPIHTDQNGAPELSLVVPFHSQGQVKGALLANIDLTSLSEFVESPPFEGAMMGIYTDEALTIASNGEVDVPGQTRLSDFSELVPLTQAMLSQPSGQLDYQLGGIEKVAFFRALPLSPELKLHLLVGVNKSLAYTDLDQATHQALWTAGGLQITMLAILLVVLNLSYRPILALKATIQDLSQGEADLTRRLRVDSQDDLGQIAEAVNAFITRLQTLMKEVARSTDSISHEIDTLKNQTQHSDRMLASHAHETSQVVTAINELSSTANSVASSASQTAAFTRTTQEQAEQSRDVVGEAVVSVEALVADVASMEAHIQAMSEDSVMIASVLSVIGEIAEQTNLLALNAAIEAARAGEQGRGFAVVADEVRALAARTQQSTSEIRVMLDKLNDGSRITVEAMTQTKQRCQATVANTANVNQRLDSVSLSIDQINDLSAEISTAAEQQHVVTEEVSHNMVTIHDIIQTLTQSSQETLTRTGNLDRTNQQLRAVVGQFKVD